ncbi:MAG: hypothetical protein ABSF60_14250, partial [Verrucomicrobiota bacterium]
MSDSLPEKPTPKAHSIFRFWGIAIGKGWEESREKFGLVVDITLALAAIGLFVLAWYSRRHQNFNEERGEANMNYWLALIPVGLWVIWFIYHVLKAPYEIYKEQFEKYHEEIRYLQERIDSLTETKPFQINAECKIRPESVSTYAQLLLHVNNPNREPQSVRLKLVKIVPPMRGPHPQQGIIPEWPHGSAIYSSDDGNIDAATFDFVNCPLNEISAGETGRIELFSAVRGSKGIAVAYSGNWKSAGHNLFKGEGERVLTISLSTGFGAPQFYSFKV